MEIDYWLQTFVTLLEKNKIGPITSTTTRHNDFVCDLNKANYRWVHEEPEFGLFWEKSLEAVVKASGIEVRAWMDQRIYGNPRLYKGFGIELEYYAGISRKTRKGVDLKEYRIIKQYAECADQQGEITVEVSPEEHDAETVVAGLVKKFARMSRALRKKRN